VEAAINKAFRTKIGSLLNRIIDSGVPFNVNVYLPCGRLPCFHGKSIPYNTNIKTGNITGLSLDSCTLLCHTLSSFDVPLDQQCDYAYFHFTEGEGVNSISNDGLGFCQLNKAGAGLGAGGVNDRLYHRLKVRFAERVDNPNTVQIATLHNSTQDQCKSVCDASFDCTGFSYKETSVYGIGDCFFTNLALNNSLLVDDPETCAWVKPT
jgi:hypothetical protein